MKRRLATLCGILTLHLLAGTVPAQAGGNWNDEQISWRGYEEGLAAAKKEKKPVCLVFYTEWCPHCTNYSKVFHDPKVVEQSRQFVMVRLDRDKNQEISKKFVPDGEYIPRTYFLSADGAMDEGIQARADRFKYFYDEKDPASLLAGMQKAKDKFSAPPSKQ